MGPIKLNSIQLNFIYKVLFFTVTTFLMLLVRQLKKAKHSGMSQCTRVIPEVPARGTETQHFILLSTFTHLFFVPEDILIVPSMVRKMSGLRKNPPVELSANTFPFFPLCLLPPQSNKAKVVQFIPKWLNWLRRLVGDGEKARER